MHDPYRASEVDRRELVVPVADVRETRGLMFSLKLLGTLVLVRILVPWSIGRGLLAVGAAAALIAFYRSRSTRAVVVSRARVALTERIWRTRTLAAITRPERVALATFATGTIFNGEPELRLDVVGEHGRLSVCVLGRAVASELERKLAEALGELELRVDDASLQGSVREKVGSDGSVELSWLAPHTGPTAFIVGVLCGACAAFATFTLGAPPVSIGLVAVVAGLVGFALRRARRHTKLLVSRQGFSLEIARGLVTERSAGQGRLRARVFAMEREGARIFGKAANPRPSSIDFRVWELALESADGTRVIVGRELTPHELRWLAARIDSLFEDLA
jgi:hypothetical protein